VELMQKARRKGIPVISEIEFAARYTKARLIGITGSNGKTTTTLLTYHLLKNAGLSVGLGGNVGESFAKQVIADPFDYYVLELSSFQLDNSYDFNPHSAVLLNITPDHLDRYDYTFGSTWTRSSASPEPDFTRLFHLLRRQRAHYAGTARAAAHSHRPAHHHGVSAGPGR
jgi:UDP-N-acetylmuramate-alanine ligase